jgi:hypothetical protein
MTTPTAPVRWIAAAAFTAALGFGSVQAAAAPATADTALACSPSYCSWSCVKQNYDGGACINGDCVCLYAE